ncbi:MAG: class I SAM-dependent methyltransferase [Firmicutes bacterium]|nr:class I SAM-dependent methyltransferase [Bacillota bacterium]
MADKYDLAWFEEAWETTARQDAATTAAAWDREAPHWDKRARQQEGLPPRLRDTVAWLEQRGLLRPEFAVADIGCGPGRFAAEFARRCRQVLAVDVSGQMLEFGRRYAAEQGLDNIEFACADFPAADVAAAGWAGRFDLVFSAITPAVRGADGLRNLLALSRAWCCNYSFVYNVNPLHDRLLEQVFSRPPQRCKTSHSQWFYELFSLLWLRGYYPRADYYKERRDERLPAAQETAEDLCRRLLPRVEQTAEAVRRILAFLEQEADGQGLVPASSDCWFGILLWDVREQGLEGRVQR